MLAIKKLHRESANNTKPEYIFGHLCQAIALLVGCAQSLFALPLTCRIHEGVVFSNRETKTLLDKMVDLVRFVLVIHPQRGSRIFMSTDLSLFPLESSVSMGSGLKSKYPSSGRSIYAWYLCLSFLDGNYDPSPVA
jgi:hypothetical protein